MFTCPKCKSEVTTLVLREVLGCHNCQTKRSNSSVALHVKAGLGGEAKNLTETEKKHFLNRGLGADGKTCVCRDNPNKRWTF